MQIYASDSFPIDQERDLDLLEERLGQWHAECDFPTRWIGLNQGFDLAAVRRRVGEKLHACVAIQRTIHPLIVAVDAVIAGAEHDLYAVVAEFSPDQHATLTRLVRETLGFVPPWEGDPADVAIDAWFDLADALEALTWPIPWLHELRRFYETLEQGWVRRAAYYLLTWEGANVQPESIEATLHLATGRPVRRRDQLPSILSCAYTPGTSYLTPRRPGAPYLTTLLAYDVQGTWTARTLHNLMATPFDLAIAVDVQTVPHHRAMRSAELAFSGTQALLRDSGIKDAAAERRHQAAELLLHELTHQGFHQVQIAVLVTGDSPAQLDTHVAEVQARAGSQLSLTRIRSAAVQAELLKLWSTTPSSALTIPQLRRNMLSKGVGCCAGLLGYHRPDATDGVFWGLDAQRRAPLFFDLFKDNQAAHQVILGQTGGGKTVFLNTIALRSAAEGYRVISLDAFRNGERLAAAAAAGARCYSLGLDTPINICDVVYDGERWLPNQTQHVIGQLAYLLGDPGKNADGRDCYIPRRFSPEERGLLDRALANVYRNFGVTPDTPVQQMPILSDVTQALRELHVDEADAIARQLQILLFGHPDPAQGEPTAQGRAFNGHTEVDWDFSSDISCYDFSRVPDEFKALYYVLAIGATKRWMRHPARDKRRPTLLQLDEFGYAAQVEAVMNLAVEICKTARKYRVGIMLIDQNPSTFLGDVSGRQIFENAAAVIAFHLEEVAARQLGEANSALTPEHLRFLVDARKGAYVAIVGKDVYVGSNQLSRREQRYLLGS
jgi:hypothetical protein